MTESTESATHAPVTRTRATVLATRRIQRLTVAWMVGAFGGDSASELSSAAAVLWRFRSTQERSEATATKITGWLLIALAVFILCQSLYSLFGTAKAAG